MYNNLLPVGMLAADQNHRDVIYATGGGQQTTTYIVYSSTSLINVRRQVDCRHLVHLTEQPLNSHCRLLRWGTVTPWK